VEVRLGQGVDRIDADGVIVAGERISSKTVIWTAGVTPSPAGKWLAVETDRAGRVRVEKDLTVLGIRDLRRRRYRVARAGRKTPARCGAGRDPARPLCGTADPAASQRRIGAASVRYFDKGSMAVVGKGFAVLQAGKVRMSGFLAWLVWAGVHLEFLAQSNLRVSVFLQWVWTYVTGQRGSWLIIDHHGAEPRMQLPARASAPLIRPSLPLRVSGVRSRCGEHDGLGGDADTEPMRSCHIGSLRRDVIRRPR